MATLDKKTLLLEINSAITEAMKITTSYDNDYAKAIKRIKTDIKWDASPKSRQGSAITEIAGTIGGKGLAFIFHKPDISWSPCWNYLGYITGNGTAGTYSNKTSKEIDKSQTTDGEKLKKDNKSLPTSSKMFILKMAKEYPVPAELAKANLKELNTDIDNIISGKAVKEAIGIGKPEQDNPYHKRTGITNAGKHIADLDHRGIFSFDTSKDLEIIANVLRGMNIPFIKVKHAEDIQYLNIKKPYVSKFLKAAKAGNLGEATTSADVPGYATPKAFSKSGQKSNGAITNAKSIGYKKTKETHNTFKEIWEEYDKSIKLSKPEFISSIRPILSQLQTADAEEMSKLYKFVIKTDPKITGNRFRKIVKEVLNDSNTTNAGLSDIEIKIKTEIESYFGI